MNNIFQYISKKAIEGIVWNLGKQYRYTYFQYPFMQQSEKIKRLYQWDYSYWTD